MLKCLHPCVDEPKERLLLVFAEGENVGVLPKRAPEFDSLESKKTYIPNGINSLAAVFVNSCGGTF